MPDSPADRDRPGADQLLAFRAHDHRACAARVLSEAQARAGELGVRMTPVRLRTLEILLEAHRALGAYEVLGRLTEEGFGKQPPVAYRALDFLVEHGFAHRVRRLNAYTACAHPQSDHSPAFLICESCNTVAETPAAPLRRALDAAADQAGFAVRRLNLEAAGLCAACQEPGE